jgi:predicted nuclease of predicted toxin-antitoxin system
MRLLLDMNMPPALAEWLRSEGHDAIHVSGAGYGNLPDDQIFDRAAKEDRILVTFDLDFGEIIGLGNKPGLGIILLRLRFVHQSYLRERLRVAIAAAADALKAGTIVIVEDARLRIRQTRESD